MANVDAAQKLRELADTQASLRRLAVLIASGAAPETVFAAVTEEALRHFGGGTARTIRYECDARCQSGNYRSACPGGRALGRLSGDRVDRNRPAHRASGACR